MLTKVERRARRKDPQSVEVWRRAAALAIDGIAAWLAGALAGGGNLFLGGLVFWVVWLVCRVAIPLRQYGQSLGRWALDSRLIDVQYRRTPELPTLLKREGILGLETALATIALSQGLLPSQANWLLLILPLAIDGVFVLADNNRQQMLHDRMSRTIVVFTRRGFSLDLKLKRLVAEVSQRMKQ